MHFTAHNSFLADAALLDATLDAEDADFEPWTEAEEADLEATLEADDSEADAVPEAEEAAGAMKPKRYWMPFWILAKIVSEGDEVPYLK